MSPRSDRDKDAPVNRPPTPGSQHKPTKSINLPRINQSALFLLLVWGMSACLPPDFEIAPAENRPVRILRGLLQVSPDVFHRLSGCPPPALELDVATAVENPDGDRLYTAWLVNYVPGQGSRPDATSTTGPRPFLFDPCTNPKVLTGAQINTIELIVLDRAPVSFDTGEDVKTIVDPDTTLDTVVWFIGVEDLSCCGVTP